MHGPGIDQPVSVTRMGNWSDPTFLPHRNWRGHHAGASYADGTIEKNGLNLYDIPWPGDAFDATLNAPPESGNPPWLGSLLVEKTDASGQLYMRNRYFDPHSGRFTQEDPIGLAGGLNLYGFGGGDAVNYSDPFGLCRVALRDEDGKCPGGLSVNQYNSIETSARDGLTGGARDRVLHMLESGDVRLVENTGNGEPAAAIWRGEDDHIQVTADFFTSARPRERMVRDMAPATNEHGFSDMNWDICTKPRWACSSLKLEPAFGQIGGACSVCSTQFLEYKELLR